MIEKVFVIPAVPSSGSSALAGVLYHLGVDMGKVDPEEAIRKRGYEMFEDKNIWKYCHVKSREDIDLTGQLQLTQMRFRSYLNGRLIEAEGPVGVKLPGNLCMHDPEPEDLPVITLNVHRPIERCMISDRNTMIRQGVYDKLKGGRAKVIAFNQARAGDIGACLGGKMDLLSLHEPVVNITFDELIDKKEEIVPEIVQALDLQVTDEQIKTAINFLDKDKKHS